jgi:integrase
MGQRLMRRPPKYVHGYLDRHGKPRFYFRRPGYKRTPLPGLPWSAEFMTVYQEVLAGQPVPIGVARTKPGSMKALTASYYQSVAFRRLRSTTQAARRSLIDRLCREHGDKSAVTLERRHILILMGAIADKPGAANNLRKALRELMKHAIDIGWRDDNPTRDVQKIKVQSKGHHSWTESEIAQFETRYPIGSREQLALALLLYTGQRRGDVVLMGRQHISGGILNLRQEKTGAELAIPVHPALAAIIDATAREHLTFLTTRLGGPFKPTPFSNWFREVCDAAGLPHCSAHGLRKAAARRLAEAGCTTHEIRSITGHASLQEVQRYTDAVEQKRLAVSAIAKVKA